MNLTKVIWLRGVPADSLFGMLVRIEEWFASLLATAGSIWTADLASMNPAPIRALLLPPGPLETCAIGILVWLHAKWRRSLQLRPGAPS